MMPPSLEVGVVGSEVFRSIEVFVAVVDARSFVGASRVLSLSPSGVSKQIARLEKHLGIRLLQRSTRSLAPTEAGLQYYRRCAAVLNDLDAASREAASHDQAPRGVLRVTAPTLLGFAFVARVLGEFQQLYPDIKADLDLTDRTVDIIDEGYDVAIRSTAQLPTSSLVAKKLAPHEFVLCAAPSYIERAGLPKRPEELVHHRCLIRRGTDHDDVWRLQGPGGARDVAVQPYFFSNSRIAIHEATLAGSGVALLPRYLIDPSVREGRLVRILPEFRLPDRWVYAVYAHQKSLPGKLRAFLDYAARRAPDLLGRA